MKIVLLVIILLIIASLIGGYYLFKSVFTNNNKDSITPSDDNFIDSESDLMRPTAKRLYTYMEPLKEKMKKMPFEKLEIRSFDNLKLVGFLLRGNPKEVVICVHGYQSDMYSDFADKINIYLERGSSVLCLNNRAHGLSEGKYIGFSELDRFDIKNWVEKINELFDEPKIYLHGVSMGGASVIHCADMHLKNVCGIIDDCGFNSIEGLTKSMMKNVYHAPYFPLGYVAWMWSLLLNKCSFNKSIGEKCVANTDIPIVFIHGRQDHFVPCGMSESMHKACASASELHLIDNCGHSAAYMVGKEEYTGAVNRLLNGEIK